MFILYGWYTCECLLRSYRHDHIYAFYVHNFEVEVRSHGKFLFLIMQLNKYMNTNIRLKLKDLNHLETPSFKKPMLFLAIYITIYIVLL